MAAASSASRTFRGEDTDKTSVFRLHFEWEPGMKTSLHKHDGWELVLVQSGELNAVIDGIWSSARTEFDVIGRAGLGLTMVVPARDGGLSEVPIYLKEGPWAQRPPKGRQYTPEDEADELKRSSMTLVPS